MAGRWFTPSALRRAQLQERDGGLRLLAMTLPLTSGREMARLARNLLRRQAATANRSADDRAVLARKILAASGGRVPSEMTIRRALAGLDHTKPRQ